MLVKVTLLSSSADCNINKFNLLMLSVTAYYVLSSRVGGCIMGMVVHPYMSKLQCCRLLIMVTFRWETTIN